MAHPAPKMTSDIERLEARISSEKKAFLKNAADLSEKTLTDFVIHAAYEEALRVMQEHQQLQQLHLSVKDREVFIHALLHSPAPSEKLLAAVKKYKKDIISK